MSEEKGTILVIDDDQDFLEWITDLLQIAGFQSVRAGNAFDGLKQLSTQNPQMVILDINMPDLDGLQTCRMIRAIEKYKGLPILMLTGRGDITDMMEARKMGADDYLVKPFESASLLSKIERLLER